MSNPLPKSWEDFTIVQLQGECRDRGLRFTGIKHELIKAIVDYDIKQRAQVTHPLYNFENDPHGVQEKKQNTKEYEDTVRDLSAKEAEERYHQIKLHEYNNKISALTQSLERKRDVSDWARTKRIRGYKHQFQSTAIAQANNTAAISNVSMSDDVYEAPQLNSPSECHTTFRNNPQFRSPSTTRLQFPPDSPRRLYNSTPSQTICGARSRSRF